MAQRDGEISTGQAARMLEVHQSTVRRWAAHAVRGRGPLKRVRVDFVGRYWLSRDEVSRLARSCPAPMHR